jgi:hypothetical protein
MKFPKYKVARFIIKLIDNDYFGTEQAIINKKRERDLAAKAGQEVSEFTDARIESFMRSNEFRSVYTHMAVRLFNNALNKDLEALTKTLRYDNKKSLQLFKMYTGIDLGTTDKVIRQRLKEYCS